MLLSFSQFAKTDSSDDHDATGPAARLIGVGKTYDDERGKHHKALDNVALDVNENEFFTLLGPSGCGKTTLLRLVAGFEQPTAGMISIFGHDVAGEPPERRPVNTVFQHYALFPHLSVRRNVSFGLEMLGRRRDEITGITEKMLNLVGLGALGDRRPDQLSGGQRQRVALARALAPQPKILLLDEPLSALDLKLRQKMRLELKSLQRETGITFIFVTHDQEEALAMSDRVAVMSEGRLQQLGTPEEIYETPVNRFVADFIGGSNLVDAEIAGEGRVRVAGLGELGVETGKRATGAAVTLCIRPERLALGLGRTGGGELGPFRVAERTYLGNAVVMHLAAGDHAVTVHLPRGGLRGQLDFDPGAEVFAAVEPGAVRVLDA